jgi:hypothetical protein
VNFTNEKQPVELVSSMGLTQRTKGETVEVELAWPFVVPINSR